jgi:Undecaprenyl-phosphate galactose phosphotransferase WbaP
MPTLTATPISFTHEEARIITTKCRPFISALLIGASDAATLSLLLYGAVISRQVLGGAIDLTAYEALWPLVIVFQLFLLFFGLYPGVSIGPINEIRRLTFATSAFFLSAGSLSFLMRGAELYSRAVFLLTWAATLVCVPLVRSLLRHLACRTSWWGYPIVLFGSGQSACSMVRKLTEHPEIGLRPVAVVDDSVQTWTIDGITLCSSAVAEGLVRQGIRHAVVVAPELPSRQLAALIAAHAAEFPHLLCVPDIEGICNLSAETRDIVGIIAMHMRRHLLLRSSQIAKRCLDLVICFLLSIVALPVLVAISILIKLDSCGPILFQQKRIGRRGRHMTVWKFRTMSREASCLLAAYLSQSPEHMREWILTHKLRRDPRVTRVGRVLRKLSLDELPQLWNVIRGEMSLVGPRPIIDEEIARYGEFFDLYARVMPGLTGLWQVSGRTNTSYAERVSYDRYYIENWSVWMDIYLLFRTILVVVRGEGAY